MNYRIIPAAIAIAVGSMSILAAQQLPPQPTGLRFVTDRAPAPDPGPAPVPCAIPAPGGPAHAYFDALVRRAEHFCNQSLRDQAQLNSLVADSVATNFTYAPATDTYPDRQDAAKFFINRADGGASITVKQQVWIPLNKPERIESGSVLLTFDWYWGPEFRDNAGAVTNYKAFQVMVGGKGWWTLMNSPAGNTTNPLDVAVVTDEFRAGHGIEGGMPAGMISNARVHPAGPGTEAWNQMKYSLAFPLREGRWSRYWIEIRLRQPHTAFTDWNAEYGVTVQPNPHEDEGRWHMISVWIADEDRAPQRVLYRVPMNWNAQLWDHFPTAFRLEMNSSKTGTLGPFVGYGRNVVVLRDYTLPAVNPESDTVLFQRPIR